MPACLLGVLYGLTQVDSWQAWKGWNALERCLQPSNGCTARDALMSQQITANMAGRLAASFRLQHRKPGPLYCAPSLWVIELLSETCRGFYYMTHDPLTRACCCHKRINGGTVEGGRVGLKTVSPTYTHTHSQKINFMLNTTDEGRLYSDFLGCCCFKAILTCCMQ